jgi:hypothetical protein
MTVVGHVFPTFFVIPAEAGIWVPAFAGMTAVGGVTAVLAVAAWHRDVENM